MDILQDTLLFLQNSLHEYFPKFSTVQMSIFIVQE